MAKTKKDKFSEAWLLYNLNKLDKMSELENNSLNRMYIDGIYQKRQFVINLITIAVGLIGFSIPLLNSEKQIIIIPLFFGGGITLFVILIFWGLFSIIEDIDNRIKRKSVEAEASREMTDKFGGKLIDFFENRTEENSKALLKFDHKQILSKASVEIEKYKDELPVYKLLLLFFLGIYLIYLSMWSSIFQWAGSWE